MNPIQACGMYGRGIVRGGSGNMEEKEKEKKRGTMRPGRKNK
jgi:hypothetical protein